MDFLPGLKTKIAAVGLFGLGLYQLSQGQFEAGVTSITAALGLFGLRQAIDRPA